MNENLLRAVDEYRRRWFDLLMERDDRALAKIIDLVDANKLAALLDDVGAPSTSPSSLLKNFVPRETE